MLATGMSLRRPGKRHRISKRKTPREPAWRLRVRSGRGSRSLVQRVMTGTGMGGRAPTSLRGVTMIDGGTFADFVGRIRDGDEQAAADLVRRYEPIIRVVVRTRLGDRRLRRILDSMDICQSVLASLFVRAA